MSEFLGKRRKALEDLFFANRNRQLLERMRGNLANQERQDSIRTATGIEDEGLLSKLADANIDAESLTAMSLVPLVAVAWADGNMADNERAAVLSAAEGHGIEAGSCEHGLLLNWLAEPITPELQTVWKEYVAALGESLGTDGTKSLEATVMGRARDVATAAGGILGLGSISGSERKVLDDLASAFA